MAPSVADGTWLLLAWLGLLGRGLSTCAIQRFLHYVKPTISTRKETQVAANFFQAINFEESNFNGGGFSITELLLRVGVVRIQRRPWIRLKNVRVKFRAPWKKVRTEHVLQEEVLAKEVIIGKIPISNVIGSKVLMWVVLEKKVKNLWCPWLKGPLVKSPVHLNKAYRWHWRLVTQTACSTRYCIEFLFKFWPNQRVWALLYFNVNVSHNQHWCFM